MLYKFSAWTHVSNFDQSEHKKLDWIYTKMWVIVRIWAAICTMSPQYVKFVKLIFRSSYNLSYCRAILSVESNPGLNWICFTVLFDWPRKLAPPSQPIRCKLKPIALWSLAFSRATGRLHAFTSSCHWLPLIISFTLIGRCDHFGFGFRHSIEKCSIC